MAEGIVKFGDWISEGWQLFSIRWQTWVLATSFHLVLIMIVFGFAFFGLWLPALTGGEPNLFVFVPMIIIMPIFTLASVFLMGGMHRMAQKQLRGQPISVRDVFSCTDCFGRLLIASILTGFAVFLGAMLCILPGYIVMAMLFFTIPLIVDKNVGAIEALEQSWALVKRDWLMFTLFVFVVNMIAQIGANLCLVGILATYPLLFTTTAAAYRDCFGLEGARSPLVDPPQEDTPYIYLSPTTQAQVQRQQNAACSRCNSFIPATAMFCPKCGFRK